MLHSHRRPVAGIAIVLTLAASLTGYLPLQRVPFDRAAEHDRILADSAPDTLTLAADTAVQDSSVTSHPARQHRRERSRHKYPVPVVALTVVAAACAVVVIVTLLIAPFKALHDL